MIPIGILTKVVEVDVYVVNVVTHGGVLAGIKRCPVVAETEDYCSIHKLRSQR